MTYTFPLSKILASVTPDSCESDVERKLIIPLLKVLGYAPVDWKSQVCFDKGRVDFWVQPQEIKTPYPPYLVIEAKAANQPIYQSGWQINRYMRQIGATLGLLTNGFRFRLICIQHDRVFTIAEYSQAELIDHFNLFYTLLCKKTCLKFFNALLKSQQQINQKFLTIVSESFASEEMLRLFRKQQNSNIEIKSAEGSDPHSSKGEKKSMIITVFNNKGGVGKTTMTINLAATLERLGKRVLLIDIDAQANLTMGLGIDPLNDVELSGKKDITHFLIDPKTKLEDVVYSKRWNNIQLDVIPSHIRLSGMESELNRIVDSDRVLAKKLKKHDYDLIFIDPPPSFSKVNGISLMASSGVLIPTQLSPYPVRALEYVLEQARQVEAFKDEPLPILGVAVSMYDQKSTSYNLSMTEALQKTLAKSSENGEVHLFPENTWIPRLNIVSQCPEYGYPIHQAEFDENLKLQDRESAQKAIERYENLASHLVNII